MSIRTNLVKRGGTYYYRRRVPVDVADAYGGHQIMVSLRTKERANAERLSKLKDHEFDSIFDELRTGESVQTGSEGEPPTHESKTNRPVSPAAYYDRVRFHENHRRYDAYVAVSADVEGFLKGGYVNHPRDEYYHYLTQSDDQNWEQLLAHCFRCEIKNHLSDLRKRKRLGDLTEHMRLANNDMQLAQKMLVAEIRALNDILKEDRDGATHEELSRVPMPFETRPAVSAAGPLLSVASKEWISAHEQTWRRKTKEAREKRIALFIGSVGDKPIDAYTKADARSFRDVLTKLPANWTKRSELKNLSPSEASSRATKLGLPPQNPTTANDKLGSCSSCFNWLVQTYDEVQRNPLKGIRIAQDRHPRTERDPFSFEDLRALFGSAQYKKLDRKSALYWAPIVSLYSGMRLAEICQLYVDDVVEDSECWYFDIAPRRPDQSVKTNSSIRKIPIHNALRKEGLIKLITDRQEAAPDGRLFPDVLLGQDRTYSYRISKMFGRLLGQIGIKRPRLVFHSFRHTFEDALRDAGVDHHVMNAIQGHAEGSMSDRYGNGYPLRLLNEAVQKVGYPEVEAELVKRPRRAK